MSASLSVVGELLTFPKHTWTALQCLLPFLDLASHKISTVIEVLSTKSPPWLKSCPTRSTLQTNSLHACKEAFSTMTQHADCALHEHAIWSDAAEKYIKHNCYRLVSNQHKQCHPPQRCVWSAFRHWQSCWVHSNIRSASYILTYPGFQEFHWVFKGGRVKSQWAWSGLSRSPLPVEGPRFPWRHTYVWEALVHHMGECTFLLGQPDNLLDH